MFFFDHHSIPKHLFRLCWHTCIFQCFDIEFTIGYGRRYVIFSSRLTCALESALLSIALKNYPENVYGRLGPLAFLLKNIAFLEG